jgi:NADPH:quinone reductase-like Zn-dependent oxidoreductase
MKAAVIEQYGAPEVFEIKNIPEPKIQKADDVLIKVYATSVNPIDWKTRKGNLKYFLRASFPVVLSYDAAGIVVETGKKVTKFKKGDKVYARLDRKFGQALAEYAIGSEGTYAKIPEALSFEEAAAIPLASLTAYQGLFEKGRLKRNEHILINGASGGVGHFALQFAKNAGAKVTVTCSKRHWDMIASFNPDEIVDYQADDFKKMPVKYDIIFDAVGKENFLKVKHVLKPGGRYITTLPRPKILIHFLVSLFTGKRVNSLLMVSRGYELEYVNKLINDKKFSVHIDKIFPIEKISEAHQYAEEGHTEGKIVVVINK